MAPKGKRSTGTEATGTGAEMLNLDPAVILADDNTRFNLKETRVQTLAQSILDRGRVLEPVEVEPITGENNGYSYRLTTGFYRLAAVKQLNTQGAGLTIPAVVRTNITPLDRLKTQIAENMERENQSPMDQAIAIKKMMDMGLTRMEIRELFARPGGRKGNKTQPASNSFLNMTLSFLELPKAIQDKIHLGLVGVAAAYELTKVAPEKRQIVLDRAEAERQKALEQEEKDEERLLAQEKRSTEEQAKRDKMRGEVEAASTKAAQAKETFDKAAATALEAYNAAKVKHPDAKTKKAKETAFKEAEKARLVAEADADAAQKEYEALQLKFTKVEALAAERAAKLREARAASPKGATKKGEAVGPTDVKKAAAASGASTQAVPLNAGEMRKVVTELALPGGNPKVIEIGKAFIRCFAGETTNDQLHKELVKIIS